VADLLPVEERPVDDALVGLAEDGVEGLIASDVAGRTGKREPDHLLEPLHWIFQKRCLLEDERGVTEGSQQKGEVGVNPEHLHGEGDAEHLGPSEQPLDDVLDDVALLFQLGLVADDELAAAAQSELPFKEIVKISFGNQQKAVFLKKRL
jgi:hypothetical protein